MNLDGLFAPMAIFTQDDEPAVFALGHHDRAAFTEVAAEVLQFEGHLDADLDQLPASDWLSVTHGSYVFTAFAPHWFVYPVGDVPEPILSEPFDGTMAVLQP